MPSEPGTFDLALVLTTAGATVAAALITGLIGLIKKLPTVGPWIDANREPGVAFVLSAALVIIAHASEVVPPTSVPLIFTSFLAWYGIATIAMGTHNAVKSVTNR